MKNVTFYKFDIEPENDLRLDQLIAIQLPEYSRSRIKNWMKAEKVLINGKTCSPKDKIVSTASIEIEIHPTEMVDILPEDIPLKALHEDDDFIVIDKPAGMVTHTAPGNYVGTLQNALLFRYPILKRIPRAGIIHRLDKHTSGLLIICKTLISHNIISKQIQNRSVIKKYLALATGIISTSGTINMNIGRHKINRKKMAVIDSGKEAVSNLKILKRYEKATLLEVELITGRTHQIRVHLSHLGHPIIGDKLYGFKKSIFTKDTELFNYLNNYDGTTLHAHSLEFIHPSTKDKFFIESFLPESFLKIKSFIDRGSYANTA